MIEIESTKSGVDKATPISKTRPFYAWVTVIGLLAIALGSLFSTVPEPPVGAVALVASLIVARVVWKFGRWALALGMAFGLPPMIIASLLLAKAIIHPSSFLEFVPTVLLLGIGGLMSVSGGTVALLQHRRGTARTAARLKERWGLRAAVLIIVALSLVSGIVAITTYTSVSAEARIGATEVLLENLRITPSLIEIEAGEPAKLIVRNDAWNLHTFTIIGADVDYSMRPRSERLVELPPLEAGTYIYLCRVPGHGDMRGTLIVR